MLSRQRLVVDLAPVEAAASTWPAGPASDECIAPAASRLRQRLRAWRDDSPSPVATSVRAGLLAMALLLSVGQPDSSGTIGYVGIIVGLALIEARFGEQRRLRLALAVVAAVVACAGVTLLGTPALSLLVTLSASAIGAGLVAGYAGALAATLAGAAVLLLGRVAGAPEQDTHALDASYAQWILIALVISMLTGRIHALSAPPPSTEARYVEAHRLLGELQTVAGGLSSSLDPGTVANELLEACLDVARCEYGAVLLNVGGDQLVPLALHGYQRVPWRASLTADGPIQRAWLSGARVTDVRSRDDTGKRAGSTLLVVPMTVEDGRVGVVALETRHELAVRDLSALDATVAAFALPLQTAALFDQLRLSAAAEERSRLAREMHDGIAQDLAFLGYELDAVTARLRAAGDGDSAEETRRLRQQMTSLISDLRLSMTDLRSSIGPGRGLGAALSAYARSAGTSSGITVHLTLSEGSTRLRASSEVQLLRIAHEAVNRARRRPGVANLWVSLQVDPPRAILLVEDDGPDTSHEDAAWEAAHDLRERAARMGASVRLGRRDGGGTRLRVFVKG